MRLNEALICDLRLHPSIAASAVMSAKELGCTDVAKSARSLPRPISSGIQESSITSRRIGITLEANQFKPERIIYRCEGFDGIKDSNRDQHDSFNADANRTIVPQDSSAFGEYALATGEAAVHRLAILDRAYRSGTRQVLGRSGLRIGMHVADVGCGVGIVTRLLADLVGADGSVVGIDVSEEQLEQARCLAEAEGLANVTFVQGDAL